MLRYLSGLAFGIVIGSIGTVAFEVYLTINDSDWMPKIVKCWQSL